MTTHLKEDYICVSDSCFLGMNLGELPIKVIFNNTDIQSYRNRKILMASGKIIETQHNTAMSETFISIGEVRNNNKISILKEITSTNKNSKFSFNEEINKNSVIIFNSLGYRSELFVVGKLIK